MPNHWFPTASAAGAAGLRHRLTPRNGQPRTDGANGVCCNPGGGVAEWLKAPVC